MIDTEQAILLELLKASIFQIEPVFSPDADWDRVYKLAKEQAILALAEPSVPPEHRAKWTEAAYQNIAGFIRISYEQTELMRLFQQQEIPVAVLKGTAAAIYYPDPIRRAMGDIDLIVSPESFSDAQKLMEDNGYQFFQRNDRHSVYEKAGVQFELHWRFSSKYYRDIESVIQNGLKKAVQYQVGDYPFPGLPRCENGLVLLGHLMQHLKYSGLGLRQVIDWMMFVHRELDEETWETELRPLARDAGLEKLALVITFLCKKWLGLPDEASWCSGADEDLADQILMHVFIDGNFGHEKPVTEAIGRRIRKEGLFSYLQHSGENKWKAAQTHPSLRPFAWLYTLGVFARKSMQRLRQSRKILSGFKSGRDMEEIWEKLD